MGKLIDADALKKKFAAQRDKIEKERKYGWEFTIDGFNGAIFLTGVEAAKNGVGWILCSERLPEPEGCKQYLVTEAHYDPKLKGRHVTVDEYEARDPENPPYWVNHREDDGIRVVAWQPMPEPWEGKE